MKLLAFVLALLALLVAAGLLVRLLNPLPSLAGRSRSAAPTDTAGTPIGRATAAGVAAHGGLTGVYPLTDARNAFAARVRLARAATVSLDVQYYIWHADMTGTLLFDEMRAAADRGVRVRMLLDDNGTSGLDPLLAALDAHPRIEVRLFNPFVVRSPRFVGYATDFFRLNRRMHNKSFTADGQATIVGGRNVGDEYFGAGDGTSFSDLDLLGIGPVVADVGRDFDRYWASASSYPAARILPPAGRDGLARLSAASGIVERNPAARRYVDAVRASRFVDDFLGGRLAFEWAPTRLVSDDPAKGLGRAAPDELLWPKLEKLLGRPTRTLGLVSGYFVPTATGTDIFTDLARRGVEVAILTNAFEATDVPIVHAGYAQWRKPLLRAGVKLYEHRGSAAADAVSRNVTGFGSTGSGGRGASSALHAKTFTVDGGRIFVGSFNFDPRSANLNTELGFIVRNPALARRVEASFRSFAPTSAYEVRLSKEGDLYWLEQVGGATIRHDTEPGMTAWQRATVVALSFLPIEWLL